MPGPALKALKLSGMPDTLEARLAEACAGRLGHTGCSRCCAKTN